jgi:NTP pyrophosphatase (non-canonical NTP hydrolase)
MVGSSYMDDETTIQTLKKILLAFREERDWEQFHDPKNLAEAISIEAGELQELFLWKDKDEIKKKLAEDPQYRKKIEDELADIFNYCLNFANATDIDLASASRRKMEQNRAKYPADKAKGIATKYTDL